jgi:hypothetical protein
MDRTGVCGKGDQVCDEAELGTRRLDFEEKTQLIFQRKRWLTIGRSVPPICRTWHKSATA